MMYNLKDIELTRVNISLEKSTKEWFQYKAKTMGMTMSQLMAYILTTYSETQRNNEAVRTLKDLATDENTKSENAEMLKTLQELITLGNKGQLTDK